ncbi:S8 family serine peptidase [Streptomyces sp. NPDC058463]|uniref:S8 family serine peptidase n=1 Tax=Streptomyces sp. NPDC058463 TaxID=3346510 RepID=UPI00366A199A
MAIPRVPRSPRPIRRSGRSPRRALTTGIALTATLGGLLAAAPAPATATPADDPAQRVIVTLTGAAAASGGSGLRSADAGTVASARRALAGRQQSFLDGAKRAGLHPGSPRKLNLLVNAVAVTVKASEAEALRALPGVVSVQPDAKVRMYTDTSVPLIGAPEVWKRKDPGGKGADGSGVTVAVLDSGVDYSHPDLGGGFGEGHKVVAGHDFVNGDDDPMDDNGHGTHVAGIIAGKAAARGGVTGVAPGAALTAYKVMNANGEGITSDIVAGIEAAIDPANPHRADVINLSIGGYGDGSDPLGLAATAATRAGVVVVAAAGNEGPGSGTVGSPAAADGVIAVGASVSGLRLPGAVYRDGGKVQTYRGVLSANPPANPLTTELVDVGQGAPEDWDRAGDVEGKAVRLDIPVAQQVQDVTTWEIEQAREAERRGAVALVGGSSGGGPVLSVPEGRTADTDPLRLPADSAGVKDSGDSMRMDSVVMLGVDSTQYAELSARLGAGKVEITLTGTDVTDRIPSFSSRGPDLGWNLRPDLVAPGYDILSTVPKALYAPGHYRMSGTSMAAPHVAGAAALIRQLHPEQTPDQVRSDLVGATKKVEDGEPTSYGSGRLDLPAAADAADAGLTTSPSSLSYGLADTAGPSVGGTRKLTVNNASDKTRSVRLRVSGDAAVSPRTLRVPAGGSAVATVTVRADRPAGEAEISGEVTLTSAGGTAVRVPYLLVVRQLFVQAGPDPSDGNSGVAIFTPAPLAEAPVVTVKPPHGHSREIRATLRSGNVYEARVTGAGEGTHLVSVRARTTTGQTLRGSDGFEVTPPDSRRSRWAPVGPYDASGQITVAANRPGRAALTQDSKVGPWVTDDGDHWRQLDRLPVTDQVGAGSLVIDARNADRWWYTVNSASNFPRTSSILRTEDAGRTWQTLDTPDSVINQLVADERTRTLIALTEGGLQISTDGGDHWSAGPTGVPGTVYDAAIGGDTLYFATGDAVWARSGVASGVLGKARQVYDSKGSPTVEITADSEVVAVHVIGTGVVGSHDGGANWSLLIDPGYGVSGLTATGGDLYLGASDGIRVGRDHGRNWSLLPGVSTTSVLTDLDRWSDGSLTLSASSNGIFRGTAKGEDYRRIGIQGGTVNDLVVSGDVLLAADDIGTQRTTVPAADPDWGTTGGEGTIGSGTSALVVSPQDSRVLWRTQADAFGGFSVERSGDRGLTWEAKGNSSGQVTSLAVHPADPDRVYVGYGNQQSTGLFSTEDGGTTWKNLIHDRYFTAVSGDSGNPRELLLGAPDGLYRSDDGGATVSKVTDGRVDTIERTGSQLLIGGDTIRVSDNGGRTFRTADTGRLPLRVSDMLKVGHTLYAATTSVWETALPRGGRGVLRSDDGGRSWQNISTGLQNLDATSLATDGHRLYVGTVQGGVHRLTL